MAQCLFCTEGAFSRHMTNDDHPSVHFLLSIAQMTREELGQHPMKLDELKQKDRKRQGSNAIPSLTSGEAS